jgi:multidrug efflux pump subunit AcrA (membrane-fusion protein)
MKLFHWVQSLPKFVKIGTILLVVAIVIGIWKQQQKTGSGVQYQTATVTTSTLSQSVTASGTVGTTNAVSVTTQASGVIKNVYVKDGDSVAAGDKIAEIDLDIVGKQKSSQAYSSYLSAQNTLTSAKTRELTLHADLFNQWDTFKNLAENGTYQNGDGTPNVNNRTLPQFIQTLTILLDRLMLHKKTA